MALPSSDANAKLKNTFLRAQLINADSARSLDTTTADAQMHLPVAYALTPTMRLPPTLASTAIADTDATTSQPSVPTAAANTRQTLANASISKQSGTHKPQETEPKVKEKLAHQPNSKTMNKWTNNIKCQTTICAKSE